jgi:hypothetical protein
MAIYKCRACGNEVHSPKHLVFCDCCGCRDFFIDSKSYVSLLKENQEVMFVEPHTSSAYQEVTVLNRNLAAKNKELTARISVFNSRKKVYQLLCLLSLFVIGALSALLLYILL